jgi:hypothetical protein
MVGIVAVIPARTGSTRFPGKPLAPPLGRPMIEHVVRRASMCEALDAVYVATCDEEIGAVVEGFGGTVVMTSAAHERAGDRVAEAAERVEADIVVMIQGGRADTVGQTGRPFSASSPTWTRTRRRSRRTPPPSCATSPHNTTARQKPDGKSAH